MSQQTIWELGLGDEVITSIAETDYDFPWTYGVLSEPQKFDRFRILFRPDEEWPETPEFEALCRETKDGLWLRDTVTGERLEDVRINHDGGAVVWFRTHR